MATTMATRDLADVSARLKHMDELGIDVQVLYPSIFLDQCTERPDTDVALCGAYNRWLADVWKQSEGRLRWMCTLPLLSMSDALDQLKFAQENGACGIFMRPLEGTRQITDPYFFGLYEQAQKIDFCIGLHQANGSAAAVDMMVNPDGCRDFFNQYRIFNVGALFRIMNAGIPKIFPKLRFGFIETAAQRNPLTNVDFVSWERYSGSLGFTVHPTDWLDVTASYAYVGSPSRRVTDGQVYNQIPLSQCKAPDYDHDACPAPGTPTGNPQNNGTWSSSFNIFGLGARAKF